MSALQETTSSQTLPESGAISESELQRISAAKSVAILLGFLRMSASVGQISRELVGPNVGPEQIVRLLRKRLLRSKHVTINAERLGRTPLPCIARMRNGHYAIVGNFVEGKALLQYGSDGHIVFVDIAEFDALCSGELILATPRERLFGVGGRFGLSWFLPVVLKYKRIISEVLIASLFVQLFAMVTPLLFQVVMDKVLVHQSLTTLHVVVMATCTIAVFEVVMGGLRTYLFTHTANRIDVELGAQLFRHLLALPIGYFHSRRAGETIARVRELDNIREFLTGSALTLVVDLLFTLTFLSIMWFYSVTLTLVVLASLPVYAAIAVFVTPVLRRRVEEKFRRGAESQSFLVETVTGVETLKAMSVQPQTQDRWETLLASYVQTSFRVANLSNVATQIVQFVSKITAALLLLMGARAVINGQLTVGQLVAFNMFASYVTAPVLRLSQLWNDLQQARLSVARIGDILNTPTEPGYKAGRAALGTIIGEIAFDHVTFRYQADKREVLRSVSFTIQPGQIVGIVGSSGSGKSTLAKLVQRLYVPESGRVLIDGTDLATVDTYWLRTQIGVVLQENLLFSRTVRENIALADPSASFERVLEAAQLAGAHDFITALAEGYDTLIEERGINLSGGQRQRIAIARALLTNPRVLILDEASSALDYESEVMVLRNMRRICQNRTVLIIAHRLSTVRMADRILTIEEGRLVEDGSHDELLQRDGRYAALCKLQAGIFSNLDDCTPDVVAKNGVDAATVVECVDAALPTMRH